MHVFGPGTRILNRLLNSLVRFQHLPVPFELYSDGIDLPVFEEFGAGTAALHLRDQLERNELLADPEYRRRFRASFDRKKLGPTLWHRDFHDATIVECPDATLIGKSFGQIADERGVHPLDAFLDVLVENGERNVRWTTIVANHRPKHLNALAIDPSIHMGFSDAGAHLRNMAFYNFAVKLLRRVRDAELAGKPFMTVEHAVHRLTAEVAEWFGLDAGTLREGDRADFVVIDPAGLDDSVDAYHEQEVPFYGGLSRMVNRNDAAIVATGVNGEVVFREGEFREGYGETVKSGRFLKAGQSAAGITSPPEMARTQQQRREDTIARLLDASIETIIEIGYARASAKVIAQRAEVSDGALFRYFPTMGDLMAATAHEAGRRQLEVAAKRIADIPPDRPAIEGVLAIIRDLTSNSDQYRDLRVDGRRAHRREAAGHAARGDGGLRREDLRSRAGGAVRRGDRRRSARRTSPRWWRCSSTPSTALRCSGHVLKHPEIEARRIPVLMALLNAARP